MKSASLHKEQHELVKSSFLNLWVQRRPFNAKRGHLQIAASGPVGLGAGIKSIDKSRAKWSSSTVCSAALVSFAVISCLLCFVVYLSLVY